MQLPLTPRPLLPTVIFATIALILVPWVMEYADVHNVDATYWGGITTREERRRARRRRLEEGREEEVGLGVQRFNR
jgi:hypothetical protein